MATKIEITQKYSQGLFEIGDIGIIDGYVRAADGKPYSVVIVRGVFDLVPVWALKLAEK